MVTLADLMDEIAAVIRATLDTGDNQIQVEGRYILAPAETCVDVYPGEPSDDQTLAGFSEKHEYGGELLTIRARCGSADIQAEQYLLLAMMDDEDPLSVSAALEADPTLNGLAATLHLRSRTGIRSFQDPSGEWSYIGCLWTLVVVKARS